MFKAKAQDDYVQVDQVDWQDFPEDFHSGGVKWKLLHVSQYYSSPLLPLLDTFLQLFLQKA